MQGGAHPSSHGDVPASRYGPFAVHTHEAIDGGVLALLDILGCTECHGPLTDEEHALQCERCGHRYRQHEGLMDFAPFVEPGGMAQRLAPALAAAYDSLLRPLLVRAASYLGEAAAARWLDRWLCETDGPLLDLGCATGRYTRLLASRRLARPVIGIDLAVAMLHEAQRLAGRGLLPALHLRGSAMALPLRDQVLAGITSFMSLHRVEDPGLTLDEVARTLAPGGCFAGITVARSGWPAVKRLEEQLSGGARLHLFDEPRLAALLTGAGLEPLAIRHDGLVLLFAARRRAAS